MKHLLLFFIATICLLFGNAQSLLLKPGTGSTFSYNEEFGISENNIAFLGKDKSGRIYARAYFGSLYIIGNNYIKKINFPADIPLNAVREIDGEVFLFGSSIAYLLAADTIQASFKMPAGVQGCEAGKQLLFFSCVQGGQYKLYGFRKRQFYLIHSSTAAPGAQHLYTYDTSNNFYCIHYYANRLAFYKITGATQLEYLFAVQQPDVFLAAFYMLSESSWYVTTTKNLLHYNQAKLLSKTPVGESIGVMPVFGDLFLHKSVPGFTTVSNLNRVDANVFVVPHTDKLIGWVQPDSIMHTLYFGTYNKPFRFFPYVKQYTHVFPQTGTNEVTAITQDSKGRIWAGSYEKGLTAIDSAGSKDFTPPGINFMPSALSIGNCNYFIAENNLYGLQQYDMDGRAKTIKAGLTGYYQYVSADRQRYYFGTNQTACLFSDIASLQKGRPVWTSIDSSKGYFLRNTITITEDTLRRVWMGHSGAGWAVYDPKKGKAVSFLMGSKQTDFGFMSSCTDSYGTVWMGSWQKGLLFYDDYSSSEVLPGNVHSIQHPLLQKENMIHQLMQWGKWLVIGVQDKLLLMDLAAWHQQKRLLIRYLNPQEAGFRASLEQNAILTDRRDSSIWFATGNMLYQWDIKKWLSLPVFIVHPVLEATYAGTTVLMKENTEVSLAPTQNSLQFTLWFQSPDNMPRFTSVSFAKSGDSLNFGAPSLETHFQYNNQAPGSYTLAVQVCQADGAVTIHRYYITINKFWWQRWRVWALASLITTLIAVYITAIRRKKILAEEIVKRKEAELEAVKAEQEKQLARMQVVSLSSQFRPHFILNALNTIGAQMDDKPAAESVLSRLGESISIIFSHAQQQKIAHSFADEWSLVKNIIHIHQLMYLKNLQVTVPGEEMLKQLEDLKLPLGLLQIPVENALLHGLSNKETSPWILAIEVGLATDYVTVTVTDNGVGRRKAATLSNYRKHGTGTKNIAGILDIVNAVNREKITMLYKDDVLVDENGPCGTAVIITIPIQFNYEA